MNPFTYKAHPVLLEWIDLITQSSTNPGHDLRQVLLLLLLTTPLFGLALRHIARKADEISLPWLQAFGLAMPSALLYTPLILTLLNDVVHHAFVFSERWFLLFALVVANQTLAAFYAFLIHSPKERGPVGLESGLGISLFLLLTSMPIGLAVLGIDALIHIF
jgi:hypothetical protein